MKLEFKRFLIKLALLLIKAGSKLKSPLGFVFKYLRRPIAPLGRIIYRISFFLYKIYYFFKRQFNKHVPTKDILGIATNKYIIHTVVVIIAVLTVSQNLYAHTGALGDYGKNSILFQLTKPIDDEEIIEGLPIHSDIEGEKIVGDIGVSQDFDIQQESYNTLGFIGNDHTPTLETQSTRTSIEYYVVQKGDTLGGIAETFGISLNTLLWANQLSERSYIRPGDKLTILPVSGVAHTVKKDETLSKIATKYKAEEERILEFNHLADAKSLQVGQVVVVPDGKIIYIAPKSTYSSGYSATYASSGKLLWPLSSRRITQYFNWRHPGLDIGASSGSRLLAAESGRIIYSGWGTGYGYQVLIDHGNGIKTRYAHASRLYVRAGDQVNRGQVIALSGNTGWSTGPHLHFEVYINGVRRNPLLYIK